MIDTVCFFVLPRVSLLCNFYPKYAAWGSENVDILFIVHDSYLEKHSLEKLMFKRLESHITQKSLGTRNPNELSR
jgi:hypothetical protein